MRVKFVDEAAAEFLDILSYYEQQQPKLGRRFKEENEQTLRWLAENSEVCRLRSNGYRRLNLRIFPYYIPYINRGPILWVLAIAHDHRAPEYWIQRKNKLTE